MTNPYEVGPEKIPTREEVVEKIKEKIRDAVAVAKLPGRKKNPQDSLQEEGFEERELDITREESDEQGLYFLEVSLSRKPGEDRTEYAYTRRGDFPGNIGSIETTLQVIYYDEYDVPTGGDTVADYRDGMWVEPKG
jgi:hypothetical protein